MKQSFFTDIHSHFIFAIDDGAENQERSLCMLEQAADCNIRQLVATPHITDLMDDHISEHIQKNFNQLKKEIAKRKIELDIYLGSELFYCDQIESWLQNPWATINNNRTYLLFELPLFDLPDKVGDFIFQCKLNGLTPILAHPERYIYLQKNLDYLLNWRQQGCLMQMNAGSLTGQFGEEVESFTKRLIEANFFSLASSDAHNVEGRNFKVLVKAYEIAKDILSTEDVNKLFIENTNNAVKGNPIDPAALNEDVLNRSWFGGILDSLKNFRIKSE